MLSEIKANIIHKLSEINYIKNCICDMINILSVLQWGDKITVEILLF